MRRREAGSGLVSVLAAGALVLLAAGAGFWWFLHRSPAPTNLILITVDTLRADHLSLYGYPKPTSPNLDRFAREALVFRNAYAHVPVTVPSLSTLMTGYYAHETKALTNHYRLPDQAVTLAEMLRDRGYRTGAVVSSLALLRDAGLDQGFEDYDERLDEETKGMVERKAPSTTQAALAWLQRHRGEKLFLWVHYIDPHGPYTPPAPYDAMFTESGSRPKRTLPVNEGLSALGGISEYQVLGDHRDPDYYIAQYDGEIRFFDEWVGKFFAGIRELGLMDATLVIVTADHGESLGEHDYYFDHTDYVYEQMLRVPLIMRMPGRAASGQIVDRLVGHVQVLSEILRQLGVSSSLPSPALMAEGVDEPLIYAETFYRTNRRSLTTKDWKLIRTGTAFELFDRQVDRAEQHNLMETTMRPELLAQVVRLKEALEPVVTEDRLHLGAPVLRRLSRQIRDQFKSLGYVQ